ncbi:MAG: DUF2971 domain-containing protein [Alcanivoracaceae bacterium]|nr:DUF2971 domain-containing protein [Alcanivoracaceae bacterium]
MAVLENCSLRWREPKQFNDPFDHQMSFNFSYTQDQFSSAIAEEVERLVYSDDEPVFIEETGLSLMVQMLRYRRGVIPKKEVLHTLREGAAESGVLFQQYQEKINSLIVKDLNLSRVICVSEKNDNVVMWSHYAGSHSGVCVRLQCIEEIDNALLMAKPVNYSKSFPLFPSLQEHVKHLTGEAPIDFSELLYQVPYIKHEHWSYESEWRVHVPYLEPENEFGFNDWRENPRVFGAIYFGCRIAPRNAAMLMQIIEFRYPHMEVYFAKPSDRGFKIEFERIK